MMDYVRVVYKRRWIAMAAFLVLFVIGTVNALRQTPVYQASVQLLIETDTPKVARLDQMFQSDNYYAEEFRQTQYRILQSRSLAKGTIDAMKLWDAPKLGNGQTRSRPSADRPRLARGVHRDRSGKEAFAPALRRRSRFRPHKTTAQESSRRQAVCRIDQFLSGLSIVPARNSRIVEVRYASTDPQFAAAAANAVVKMYIQQNMESGSRLRRMPRIFCPRSWRAAEGAGGERGGPAGVQRKERHRLGCRQRLEHRGAAAQRLERGVDESQNRSNQQGSAVQPAQIG
jgi:uncharacterized protein involved in exopolysaccharide biosynthesis